MITTLPVAPNVTLHAIQTDKFKTACFSVNFLRPHCEETAALDALLPSVLLRATERYPDISSISGHLDELYGATFGTLLRRKGEVKLPGFYADFIEDDFLPAGETVFAPMVDFLEEVLYHPLTEDGVFCQRNVEGEKQNLINAIEASLNDKRTYATTKLLQTMCATEAYGIPRLGRVEDVAAITPAALWAHYQQVLASSRVELFYAGRQTPEAVAARFSKVFSAKKWCAPAEVGTEVLRQAGACKELCEVMDITQGKLVMGLRTGITVSDPDYPALLLLNAVYGAGMSSKLFLNVREKLSLCYYASSVLEKYKGLMLISSGVDFSNYDRARAAILNELEACKRGEISAEELETARRMVLSALRASMDSPVQLDEFYMGAVVAPGDDIPVLMDKVAALTVADLTAAARKLTLDTVYFLKGETV